MKNVFAVFAVGVVVGAVALFAFQKPTIKEVKVTTIDTVRVALTPKILDSLKLSFKYEFEGTLKPRVIAVEDTAKTYALMRKIYALRDSLKGKAALELGYYNENLEPYGDTLEVRADFISQMMFVRFNPKPREFTQVELDTVTVPVPVPEGDPWWMRSLIFVGGALVGGFLAK